MTVRVNQYQARKDCILWGWRLSDFPSLHHGSTIQMCFLSLVWKGKPCVVVAKWVCCSKIKQILGILKTNEFIVSQVFVRHNPLHQTLEVFHSVNRTIYVHMYKRNKNANGECLQREARTSSTLINWRVTLHCKLYMNRRVHDPIRIGMEYSQLSPSHPEVSVFNTLI